MLAMINRGRIEDPATVEEFENLMARLRGFLSQSFDEDGNLIVADPNLAVTPVGGVIQFAGTVAPAGWLLCDGSPVSRTTYKSLFDVVGTTYGSGDGSTTFNPPDLRQRFPLGKAASGTGSTLGATGGAIDHVHSGGAHTHTVNVNTSSDGDHDHTVNSHAHTIGSDGSHTHTYSGTTSGPSGSPWFSDGGGSSAADANHTHDFSGTTSSDGSHSHGGATGAASPDTTHNGDHHHTVSATTSSASGTTGAENPPYLVMNFIIFAGV